MVSSFSQSVKEEVLVKKIRKVNYKIELIALFKAIGNLNFEYNSVTIDLKTSQIKISKRVIEIIHEIYPDVRTQISVRSSNKFRRNNKVYILKIMTGVRLMLLDLGLVGSAEFSFLLSLNDTNFTKLSDSQKRHYVAMFFAAQGTVNDPSKSGQYHLEISSSNERYLEEIAKLVLMYDINFKITKRRGIYALYSNRAEEISDFLKLIDASNSALDFENNLLMRGEKRKFVRLNNAEVANEVRKVMTVNKQIEAIEHLKKIGQYDLLSDKARQVADLRLLYPEDSLNELSLRTDGKISKSNCSYHLRNIVKLSVLHLG